MNLMHRKIRFVISDEVMPVETQPLVRKDCRVNFARKQKRQVKTESILPTNREKYDP